MAQRYSIEPYDPCPCESGKKYKFCCGQKNKSNAHGRYPVGTVAFYGPDDRVTTKIAAAVMMNDFHRPVVERWFGTDVTEDAKVTAEIRRYFASHGVKTVVVPGTNIGCPHEEAIDFPAGTECPFCPFWTGRQGIVLRSASQNFRDANDFDPAADGFFDEMPDDDEDMPDDEEDLGDAPADKLSQLLAVQEDNAGTRPGKIINPAISDDLPAIAQDAERYASEDEDAIERMDKIVGGEDVDVDTAIEKLLAHLIANLTLPCLVTSMEDFNWEEPYVFGGWDEAEYAKLRKRQPSCEDRFELIGLSLTAKSKWMMFEEDISAHVKRVSDGKLFTLGLAELTAVEPSSPTGQLINDYSTWFFNMRWSS